MTQTALSSAPAPQTRILAPLNSLGLAPENLRAEEPEDSDIPRLAETIRAAGLIYPLLVRRGRRDEAAYMVLDGRRRRFALLRLAADGVLPEDHPVDCVLAEDRAAQAAAAVLPNAEHAPVHLADIILEIGKLRRSRLTTAAIAEALGYDETEVRRLDAMAKVHPDALQAFRAGRLTLRQVRMFARVKDQGRQAELARNALDGRFFEGALQSLVTGARVTTEDPRFALVGEAAYAAAGGRLEADLFGELPAQVLDPELLDEVWRAEATRRANALAEAGLTLLFARERGYAAPEGLAPAPFVYWGGLTEAQRALFEAAQARIEATEAALDQAPTADRDEALAELMRARLALARLVAGRGEVAAVLLTPVRGGLDLSFFHRPAEPEPAVTAEGAAPDHGDTAEELTDDAEGSPDAPACAPVETEGVSHAQHAAHTDVATRGLVRALADDPETAVVALTAHLFAGLALHRFTDGVLRIRAFDSVRPGEDLGDPTAEVWARLRQAQADFEAAGLGPIAFVGGLPADARLSLLGLLVAVTADLRESRTDALRTEARRDAAEIAARCDANLARHWTPTAEFLALHTRGQLLGFLAEMGAEVAKPEALRKPELVQAVAAAAEARRWLPACLRWPHAETPAGGDAEPDGGDALDAAA